jgi:hypothetical protein
MFTHDVLEIGKILGSIVLVWFLLIGWKVLLPNREFDTVPTTGQTGLPPKS